MQRKFYVMLILAFIAACGGGSEKNNLLKIGLNSQLPEEFSKFEDEVSAKVGITDVNGSIYSSTGAGKKGEGVINFEVELIGDVPAGSLCVVDFEYPLNLPQGNQALVIARLTLPFERCSNGAPITPSADNWNFSFDPDGDGLTNISELNVNTNPLAADSDLDGIIDSLDESPLIADKPKDAGVDNNVNVPDDIEIEEEVSEPLPADSDADNIYDETDNCPLVANPYQDDTDKDGRGDECDDDLDGDGRPNSADNCPYLYNPKQLTQDADGDGIPIECDLDDTDAYVRDAHDAVFVDCAHGDDSARGTLDAPVAAIKRAVELSILRANTIYAAACIYDVPNVNFPAHTRIAGGFFNSDRAEQRFKSRDIFSADPQYEAVLTRNDVPITIILENDDIVIDGFNIKNEAAAQIQQDAQATVKIKSKLVTIENSAIQGNTYASNSAAVAVTGDSFRLSNSRIDGGGLDCIGCESMGVYVQGAQNAVITNNTILGGQSRFEKGVGLEDSDATILNNRIEATGAGDLLGAAQAFVFSDSNVILKDNYLLTDLASEQYSVICLGGAPSELDEFINNRFARFPADDDAILVRNCNGTGYRDVNFVMGRARVEGNTRTQER